MRPERWQTIEDLYHTASGLPDDQRDSFLRSACGEDQSLLREIESLLRQGDKPQCFLDSPAVAVMAKAIVADELRSNASFLEGKSVSHYRILETIGRGGMGVIYKAEDLKLGRMVALKLLPAYLARDPQALQRFEREARAASALNHPNICTVYEIDEADGLHFISIELLQGETLKSRLVRGPLPIKEIVEIASDVCQALEAAHSTGIVHRDIKPANIFLTQSGTAKVLDFGVAKRVGPEPEALGSDLSISSSTHFDLSLTTPGAQLGTAAYMSPEQAGGQPVDARSDIFSLGSVLYEMTTAQLPFSAKATEELIESIQHENPKPIVELNPKAPPGLIKIVTKAMKKAPALRYQDATEVQSDLTALRARLETKGNWRKAILVAAVVAVLLGLAAFASLRVPRVRQGILEKPPASTARQIKSLAVLPLANLTGELPRSDDHILIWKVGSPYRGDVPDATVPVDLQEAAQKLGHQIAMETYPAEGFALRFTNAIKRKAEPDVLAFDNYGVLTGITASLGSFEGLPVSDRKVLISVSESLQSLEDEHGGWEFLIATSHNFGKAKDLVLNSITCNGRSAGLVTDPALLSEITGPTLYAIFAGVFGGNTGMAISSLFGEDSVLRDSPKVNDIRICGIWGNRRLAFVNTAILFQSATALGHRSSLVVLTRAGSSWELKLISRDVRIIRKLSEQLPKLANDTDGGHLQAPSLRDPPDQARLPRFPESERPVLEWDNSGLQTAAYLIESQFEESPAAWSDSAFELVLQRAPRTVRVGAPFGVGMQPHRWRIWAIDKNGGTAISGWRTINYTN